MKSKYKEARSAVSAALARKGLENYLNFLRIVLDHNAVDASFRHDLLGKLRNRDLGAAIALVDSFGRAEQPSARKQYLASQFAALLKKVPFDSSLTGFNPEGEAINKFRATERRVGRYNLRYRLRNKFKRYGPKSFETLCSRWILKVIGEQPDYPKIWSSCRFGPGASVGVSGNVTHFAAKTLAAGWTVTPTALPYALAAMRSDPHSWEILLKTENSPYFSWDPSLYEKKFREQCILVDYNKIALVPKTAMVHRTIAVEPLLNGFLQNGVDAFLRRRLHRFGIDLTDQSRNQELARIGSLGGEDPYVTIDLSEASDSISKSLVQSLLPPDWFYFLTSLRSPNYLLKGEKFPYEKFCSMGNGFCFPLETLIFSSVCHAAAEFSHRPPDFSVYGDDIIVRQSLAREVLKRLSEFGFRHNPDKTFLQGPFRESCGADWYSGEDVRPVTVTHLAESLADVFTLHNKTLRSLQTTDFFEAGREFLRSLVPPDFRYVRPYKGNDDSAFQVERDLFMTSKFAVWNRKTYSWQWTEMVSYTPSDRSYDTDHRFPSVLLQAALRGVASDAPFTRRRNTRTRVRIVSHHGGHSTWLPSTRVC